MNAYRSTYKPRLVLHVSDMTSKRSAGVVIRAVMAVDRSAKITFDLTTRNVVIEPNAADVFDFSRAISSAGFMPTLVTNPTAHGLDWVDSRDFDVASKPAVSKTPAPRRARAQRRVDLLELGT